MHVQLPLATGSGRIIRILIQRTVAPGATYRISGQSGSTNFEGTLLMHNKSAESFNTILKTQTCASHQLALTINAGGEAGGKFDLVDVGRKAWLVSGNLYAKGPHVKNPCSLVLERNYRETE